MRPGQTEPNELELAVLAQLALQEPAIGSQIPDLHVLSRMFTGVGCYTRFWSGDSVAEAAERQLVLNAEIRMPGVPNGMGAVLFSRGGLPFCLELFTYGDDHWDGVFDGFAIARTV